MNTLIHPTALEHLFVVVLTGFGLFAVLRGQPKMKQTHFDRDARISVYWLNGAILLLAGAIPVALWWLAGRPLADLGLTAGSFDVRAAILTLVFVVWWTGDATWRMTGPRRAKQIARLQRDVPFAPTTGSELVHFSFLALAAGVSEEIIFRGFLIQYVASWTGGSGTGLALAILLPGLAFGLVHLYQGWRIVAWIVVMSILWGAIFVVTGSLVIPMVLHTLVDLIGGVLVVRLRPSDTSTGEPLTA